MTIDEAIVTLEREIALQESRKPTKKTTAVRLGIEALRAIIHYRSNPHFHQVYRLEGETEE